MKRNFPPLTREQYVLAAHPKTTPKWAIDLAIQVLDDEKFDGIVCLIWRRNRGAAMSSGHVRNYIYDKEPWMLRQVPEVVLTAGLDRVDQRYALLHELAHVLEPDAARGHHRGWAECAWRLYRKYMPRQFGHCALRGVFYKPSSLKVKGAPTPRELMRAWKGWPYQHAYNSQKEAQIIAMFSDLVGPRGGTQRRLRRGAA